MRINESLNVCSQLEGDEESGESGGEGEGEGKAETSKVYKPPKLAAMHYGKSPSCGSHTVVWGEA